VRTDVWLAFELLMRVCCMQVLMSISDVQQYLDQGFESLGARVGRPAVGVCKAFRLRAQDREVRVGCSVGKLRRRI
jgi:hypothetical protein